MHSKLLRVLQEHQIERIGSALPIHVDVRVIAATNRPLEEMVTSGTFRQDLYYRLNVVKIHIPPLRQRKTDIPLLVDHFIRKYARVNKKPLTGISKEALDICMEYDWPGNVRELENAIENAVVLGEGDVILPEHLPITLKMRKTAVATDALAQAALAGKNYREKMENAERLVLAEAIRAAGGNKSEAVEGGYYTGKVTFEWARETFPNFKFRTDTLNEWISNNIESQPQPLSRLHHIPITSLERRHNHLPVKPLPCRVVAFTFLRRHGSATCHRAEGANGRTDFLGVQYQVIT